ncbi:MAG: hypothetical protein CMN30_01315 [Sandaracinus sp.]|nr:hypothetical protein [Sandaracinus sp.]
MRTFLCLLALHAACDGPSEPVEPEATSGETPATEAAAAAGTREAPASRGAAPVATHPPDPADWETLVSTYVTDEGFRYEALKANEADRAALARYVDQVGAAEDTDWEKNEALAFYVNAYNALTVTAVLERWPIEGVMRVPGFFDSIEHQVAGETRTLNALENDVIRSERFAEPRIHFVVNCASKSCPPLGTHAYTAANIEGALATAAEDYVRATTEVSGRRVKVSRLFEWFANDFGGTEGVRTFVADRLEGEDAETVRNERTDIGFHDYDWAINAVAEEATTEGEADE